MLFFTASRSSRLRAKKSDALSPAETAPMPPATASSFIRLDVVITVTATTLKRTTSRIVFISF
jgi:hypothetical protein